MDMVSPLFDAATRGGGMGAALLIAFVLGGTAWAIADAFRASKRRLPPT